MPSDLETCRKNILSEDYRDFIGNHVRTSFFDSITRDAHCEQDAGFGYKCIYLPASSADPVCRGSRSDHASKIFLQLHPEMLLSDQYGDTESDRDPSCPELSHPAVKRERNPDRFYGQRDRLY